MIVPKIYLNKINFINSRVPYLKKEKRYAAVYYIWPQEARRKIHIPHENLMVGAGTGDSNSHEGEMYRHVRMHVKN